jgi:hypothetical protein
LKLFDRALGLLAILAAAAACAYFAQGPSSPAQSHYSLVKSLAKGTAVIDETRYETGDLPTQDLAYFEGHYYSNKAPGLALVTLPAFLALDAMGVRTGGDPRLMLWALSLVGALLPTVVLLFLVRGVGDRVEPGFGTAAAVTLGLGTLLTTFATMFFPHALSAFLVFTAFVLLFVERQGTPRLWLVAGAGLFAGYAFTTEYHNVFATVVLGLYALARAGWLRRGLCYAGGAVAGVMPLLVYNWWAFGSVAHLSYEGTVLAEGTSGHDVLFDVDKALDVPSFSTVVSLLLSKFGLLTTAPVLVAAIAGTFVLYRRGRRAEALVITAVGLAYLIYSASYHWPFGYLAPGPRFLIPMLPFLAVPLAIAFRAWPVVTAALAAASVAVACAFTATRPLTAWDGDVLFRLAHPSWWSPMVPDLVVVTGWYRVLPFLAALLIAVACTALTIPRPAISTRSLLGAGVALAGWVVVATQATKLLNDAMVGTGFGAFLLICIVVLLTVAVAGLIRPQSGFIGSTDAS